MVNAAEFYGRYWLPGQLVVSDMERNGVAFDHSACEEGRDRVRGEVATLQEKLNAWAGQEINWGSWQQKRQFLYGTSAAAAVKGGPLIEPRGFPVPPVGGNLRAVRLASDGEQPTSEAAIDYLRRHCDDPKDKGGLATLMRWADAAKLLSFFETLPGHVAPDGRIHPQMGATTETGRLSCKNPNLQQQPPDVRTVFVAPPGYVILALDFDGLEWRILAHVLAHRYGDTSLVDEIRQGIDPHSATAVRMDLCPGPVKEAKERYPKERGEGKVLNYSINYGKTPAGLAAQLNISKAQGQALLDGFYRARPGIAQFHQDIITYARAHGYVRSLLGRHRYIPEMRSPVRGVRRKGERLAKNVIQNCATDVVLLAMLRTCPVDHPELRHLGWHREELARWGVRALLQVHDELVFEVPEQHAEAAKKLLTEMMEGCLEGVRPFLCPLGVSGGIGPNWKIAGGK